MAERELPKLPLVNSHSAVLSIASVRINVVSINTNERNRAGSGAVFLPPCSPLAGHLERRKLRLYFVKRLLHVLAGLRRQGLTEEYRHNRANCNFQVHALI
jgi:hypothetical protein